MIRASTINDLCDTYNHYLKHYGYDYTVSHWTWHKDITQVILFCMKKKIPFEVHRLRYNSKIRSFTLNGRCYKVCNPMDFEKENEQ